MKNSLTNGEKRAEKLFELLKEMNTSSLIEAIFMQKLIQSITLKTRNLDKGGQKKDVELVIKYPTCNEMMKEYLTV